MMVKGSAVNIGGIGEFGDGDFCDAFFAEQAQERISQQFFGFSDSSVTKAVNLTYLTQIHHEQNYLFSVAYSTILSYMLNITKFSV